MGCGGSVQSSRPNAIELLKQLKSSDATARDRAARHAMDLPPEEANALIPTLAQLLPDSDLGVRSAATAALVKLGPKCGVPLETLEELVEYLNHKDNGLQYSVETVLIPLKAGVAPVVPRLAALLPQESEASLRTLRILRHVGLPASSAALFAAPLLRASRADIRGAAVEFLKSLALAGDSNVPVDELKAALVSGRPGCLPALEVVQAYGRNATLVTTAVVPLLSAGEEAERNAAQTCMDRLGRWGALSPQQLLPLLTEEKQATTRVAVVQLLAALPAAELASAGPALGVALGDPEHSVRRAAAEVLQRAGGEVARTALSDVVHLEQVFQRNEEVCLNLLQLLADLGEAAEPAAAALPKALEHPAYAVRKSAVDVLGLLADLQKANAALPAVHRLLASEDTLVRLSASEALRRLGAAGVSEGGPEIARHLASPHYHVRMSALESLEGLGPKAASIAPFIAALLADSDPQVREDSAKAFAQLSQHMALATPQLLQLLTHRKDYARDRAAEALRGLGASAVAEVVSLINVGDWQLRRRVVEQLSRLQPGVELFLPALTELLEDESLEVRLAVALLFRSRTTLTELLSEDMKQKVERLLESTQRTHGVPPYWTNQVASDFDEMLYVDEQKHATFDELLKQTYVARVTQDRLCPKQEHGKTPGGCPCVQIGGDPGLPVEYRVRRVVRVENALMWSRYALKRDAIRVRRSSENFRRFDPPVLSADFVGTHSSSSSTAPPPTANADAAASAGGGHFAPLEDDLNEVYLFHGTFVRAAVSIAKMDFRIDLAGSSTGTMYGRGAYLGEAITKADEYAKDEPGGYYDNVSAVLLCRTIMGKFYYTTKRDEGAGDAVARGEYDSTCGDRAKTANTFRELVVYDNDQIYPEYILFYERIYKATIAKAPSPALHLELPSYWTNCYRTVDGDGFNDRFDVPEHAWAHLQRLVDASVEGQPWKVTGARRVENAAQWQRSLDFRNTLQAQLAGSACVTAEKIEHPEPVSAVATSLALSGLPREAALSGASLLESLNEHYLWHGTTPEVAEAIANDGFRVSSEAGASASGLRYGQGAYFAEMLDKVLPYAGGEGDSRCVLLCRVLCGQFHYTQVPDALALKKAMNSGKHSVLAYPYRSDHREFVVGNSAQVYPEYILELRPLESKAA